jgi:UDP-N-acetyl-D-glucosamine dehydrogenase
LSTPRGHVLVVGMGYVGLPLACLAAEQGYNVVGFDTDSVKCARLLDEHSSVSGVSTSRLSGLIKENQLCITNTLELDSSLRFDVIVICVPTPLDDKKEPDLKYVISAVESVAPFYGENTLLILESSTYPGTTREVLLPIISKTHNESGADLLLAYSPERVDPGNREWNTANTPRIVAGLNLSSLSAASKFYESLGVLTHEVSSLEVAEAAKLFENSFRLVNISLVNEFAKVLRATDLDFNEILSASYTKPFGIMPFYPSAGVGGHCIAVDPYYLTWWAKSKNQDLSIIQAAEKVNENMPEQSLMRVKSVLGQNLAGRRIVLAGVTYKSGVADVRETPAEKLWKLLSEEGADLFWWDPLIAEWGERRIWKKTESDFDLVVISTRCDLVEDLAQTEKILDLNN